MRIRILLFSIFIILAAVSCVSKRRCTIVPIPKTVLDTASVKEMYFISALGKTDTMAVVEKYESLDTIEVKALANYEECGHVVGYNYESKGGVGTFGVRIDKDENAVYDILINGFCFDEDYTMTEKKVLLKPVFVINADSCANSKFKTLFLNIFDCIVILLLTEINGI
jgi:hypothetical protein